MKVFKSSLSYVLVLSCALFVMGCPGADPPPQTNNTTTTKTNNRPVDNNPPLDCSDRCHHGERLCVDDETVLNCVRNEKGCLDYGSPSTCPSGRICQNGSCIAGDTGCDDTCGLGDGPRCSRQGQVETCADHNEDGCRTYGGATSCADGEACNPDDGQCHAVDCTNTCQIGETQCDRHRLASCSEDAQGCLGFHGSKECPSGETCVDDTCQVSGACQDECEDNHGICTANGDIRLCGVWDDSGCTTYSEPTDFCFPNETCQDGDCVDASACADECIAGEKICVGNKITTCDDHNGDGCVTFSDPEACNAPGTSCQNVGGVAGCQGDPNSGVVLINEVFYDPLGHDLRGSGPNGQCLATDQNCTSPTFIELYGTPGMDIAGFHVEIISGSTGEIYNEFLLPDGAKLDGNGFAVLAMDQPDSFLAYAAPFYTNVYYVMESFQAGHDAIQNGDGSVRLYDDSNNLADAVGWGTFTVAPDNFKGNGAPAGEARSGRTIGRIPGRANTDNNSADFRTYYPTPGLPNQDLIINEVYANQPGPNDGSETFVEIAAPILGWEDLPLDGYVLRGVSGAGSDYLYTPPLVAPGVHLTGRLNGTGRTDGYGLICHSDAAAPLKDMCNTLYSGVPLYDGPDNFILEYNGRSLDAVGYGTFGAQDTFVGEGQPAPYGDQDTGKSLARWPLTDPSADVDTDHNANDFHLVAPTPGRTNPRP